MNLKKSKALTGKDNKRLNLKIPVGQNSNAAYSEVHKEQQDSKVTTPSFENVVDAKEWVDNGSIL